MSHATLWIGDVLAGLRQLPDESVRTCITSPPYWGLRDYNAEGQIGLEGSPDEFAAKMVEVFREVRRVLTKDGTLWLNLGDSYARAPSKGGSAEGGKNIHAATHRRGSSDGAVRRGDAPGTRSFADGVKVKDLVGIPWLVAFALRSDGWYLRSDIIWQKPNPMPESVKDRPTKAHEYLFLLSKSESYYYDAPAIAEISVSSGQLEDDGRNRFPSGWGAPGEPTEAVARNQGERRRGHRKALPETQANLGAFRDAERAKGRGYRKGSGNLQRDIPSDEDGRGILSGHLGRGVPWENVDGKRNARSVWTINTQPYTGAHFATFPEELPRRCILAGTSAKGRCPKCGAAWHRRTKRKKRFAGNSAKAGRSAEAIAASGKVKLGGAAGNASLKSGPVISEVTEGWKPGCACGLDPVPDVVLDPFGGSGTTGSVAIGLGREAVLIDLNPKYVELARQRIGPMLCTVKEVP